MPALPSLATAAGVAAAAAATSAYLNAKYLLSWDLKFRHLSPEKVTAYATERAMLGRTLNYHILEEHAEGERADAVFLICDGQQWTYKEFYVQVQRVASWLMHDLGIYKGEIVALDGGNSPEYLMLWFATEAIGAIVAFINCNLTAEPLMHCVKVVSSRILLADSDTKPLVAPCEDALAKTGIKTVYYNPEVIANLPKRPPVPRSRNLGIALDSLRCLIYTSGTTGMPKATMLSTQRDLTTGFSMAKYLELQHSDRFYTCMPLYHGAAHGLGVTPVLHSGSTLVLGRKFSHRRFWPEVRDSHATIVQYVGELCRYLINAPPSELDNKNDVRMAWGNGMRPDVWEPFRKRFGIETINELYAATDGMGASFNANRGSFGANAIGLRGLVWNLTRGSLECRVRIDPDTEDILRDANNFAIKCGTNEPGEVVYKVEPAEFKTLFMGYYNNEAAAEKRLIRDLFAKGDIWFRSGDMQRVDADGRVYFVDRLGDTFRWKSENVSTAEVADVMGHHKQIAEANVYGVQVPHADGRCGCAAVVLSEGISETSADWASIAQQVLSNLPRYAIPVFVRVVKSIDYTGTMKMQKGRLRKQGVDLESIAQLSEDDGGSDIFYWLPDGATKYQRFEKGDWERLKNGQARL